MSEVNGKIKLKGSEITVGEFVSVRIKTNSGSTDVSGTVTGIQLWNQDTLAIQFEGINDWIRLTENTEVSDWVVLLTRSEKEEQENNNG